MRAQMSAEDGNTEAQKEERICSRTPLILRKNQEGTQVSVNGLKAVGKSLQLLRSAMPGRACWERQENNLPLF